MNTNTMLALEKNIPEQLDSLKRGRGDFVRFLKRNPDDTEAAHRLEEVDHTISVLQSRLKDIRAELNTTEKTIQNTWAIRKISRGGKLIGGTFPERLQVALISPGEKGKRRSITRHLRYIGNGLYSGKSPLGRSIVTYDPYEQANSAQAA